VVDWSEILLRSVLFAPGNHPRKVARVADFGADAIVLDLEDAVAVGEKPAARAAVQAALPSYRQTIVLARVNGVVTPWFADDLAAVTGPATAGILVPKVDDPAMLIEVDRRLAVHEASRGLPVGGIRLIPLVETARGVARVEAIAFQAPARVYTLMFGMADFTADLGIDLTADATEILYARSRVVVAARAAGLAAPLDGPYMLDLQDRDGLLADSRRGRQLGFQGRGVIYPPHVPLVNQVYSFIPPAELALARQIVDAFTAAEAAGSAAIRIGNLFVDYPIYRRAQRTLRLAAAAGSLAGEPPG
jgi:citrate lyase subunit beta/citryl-CoA lyase